MVGLFIVVGVTAFLALTFTPLGRTIGSSVKNLLIADTMKNPKAAEAVYLTAIDEAQKLYGEAADTYNELSGMLVEANAEYTHAQKQLEETERKCEKLVKSNDDEGLKLMASKRSSIIARRDAFYNRLVELKPLVEEAKEIHELRAEDIQKLKESKDLKVSEIRLTGNMNQLYSKMDKLRNTSATDKLLGQIDSNIIDQKRKAAGAKMVHENKIETKERKLDKRLLDSDTDSYIAELKSKYNK